jgi:uncharacterized Zn finger protein
MKTISTILAAKTKAELITFFLDILPRYPDIAKELQDAEHLKSSSVDKIIIKLRHDIKKVTAEEAWYDSWNYRGEQPDYSGILKQLEALLAKGHADALLQVGYELWCSAQEQVEQSNDEGDTAGDVAECMDVVLRALPQSSLTRPQQLLWTIERCLEDDFSILHDCELPTEDPIYTLADWCELSELLTIRLAKLAKTVSRYERRSLVQWLLITYEHAHMQTNIIPLLEQEAEPCHLQTELVDALLAAGEKTKARQYCIQFYESTIKDARGIASQLQARLSDMAQEAQKPDLVASYVAQDFFACASLQAFSLLQKSSEEAACWPPIRSAVLVYLETGIRPDLQQQRKSKRWPLPKPDVGATEDDKKKTSGQFPRLDLLIEIAIHEKRLDDTVTLFHQLKKSKRTGWFGDAEEQVASAVSNTHPQIALDIWRKIVDQHIARAKPNAYVEAASYLRLMQKVYKTTKRLPEWNSLLIELRTQHKAKRRLLEVLDDLTGKKLVD